MWEQLVRRRQEKFKRKVLKQSPSLSKDLVQTGKSWLWCWGVSNNTSSRTPTTSTPTALTTTTTKVVMKIHQVSTKTVQAKTKEFESKKLTIGWDDGPPGEGFQEKIKLNHGVINCFNDNRCVSV